MVVLKQEFAPGLIRISTNIVIIGILAFRFPVQMKMNGLLQIGGTLALFQKECSLLRRYCLFSIPRVEKALPA